MTGTEDFACKAGAKNHLETPVDEYLPFACISGTFGKNMGAYGYGGVISSNGNTYIIRGTGNHPQYMAERNIAGEIIGMLQVVHTAIKLHIKEINVYFSYIGLEKWATGQWKARTELTQYYCDAMRLAEKDITIHFLYGQTPTNITAREMAYFLAREATGGKLNELDAKALELFKARSVLQHT